MAILYVHASVITRGAGKSVVAAAAYRAAEKLHNQYTGLTSDYTRKKHVCYSDILLPRHAPKGFLDRETLWNSVELSEKSPNGRLAREFVLALPTELTDSQRLALGYEFALQLIAQGMCVDMAYHNPPKQNDLGQPIDENGRPITDGSAIYHNPHLHLLCTMRPLDQHGNWEPKFEKVYLCIRSNETREFTASEFKEAKLDGWEKQYLYDNHGQKEWLALSKGKALGLKKIRKDARVKYGGRENPVSAQWNSSSQLLQWKAVWMDMTNRHLQKNGISSLLQWPDKGHEPTLHLGPQASYMEKRAKRLGNQPQSEKAQLNRLISAYNQSYDTYHKIKQAAGAQVMRTASHLSQLHAEITSHAQALSRLQNEMPRLSQAEIQRHELEHSIAALEMIAAVNLQSMNTIAALENAIAACGVLHPAKRKQLQKQVETEQQKVSDRNAFAQSILNQHHVINNEHLQQLHLQISAQAKDSAKIKHEAAALAKEASRLREEYQTVLGRVPPVYMEQLQEKLQQAHVPGRTYPSIRRLSSNGKIMK